MVSEKTKANIGGFVGVVGILIITAIIFLFAFGDLWPKIFAADRVSLTTEGTLVVIFTAIGIMMASLGLGTAVRIGKKGMKEKIGDFANQALKSKGKVSLKDIASHVKMSANIKILEKEYLKPMIEEGYFENARYENGWLVKDIIPCPYCNEPVQITAKKCPNCGATIKK
ncbi:MAG: zinc ribbon domain-containing protein [Candidatus Hadarchaeota archaeon]